MTESLRDVLEKLADEFEDASRYDAGLSYARVTVRLRELLRNQPAEPVGVSDEAVAKAEYAYEAFGATMRDALEAAAPLMGATPRPTREQIADAIAGPAKDWLSRHQAGIAADAVLALMGGAE